MYVEGQRALLFGSCKCSHLSHDNILKNMPKVIGSLIGSLLSVLDEVTFPHGMMSLGWDVTSDSIRLGRLVDGKVNE